MQEYYESKVAYETLSLADGTTVEINKEPTVAEAMEKTLEVAVMPTYAMTESMPICSNPLGGPAALSSVGGAAGPEVRIAEPGLTSAKFLPDGQEGEVVVRGACVTSGYEWRQHMAVDPNEEAFVEGWMRTGDAGWFDEKGYLNLTGRFKEIINRGGEKLSPFAVEQLVQQHPAVKDVMALPPPTHSWAKSSEWQWLSNVPMRPFLRRRWASSAAAGVCRRSGCRRSSCGCPRSRKVPRASPHESVSLRSCWRWHMVKIQS